MRIWDLNLCKELFVLQGHEDFVFSVAITSDKSKIASGSRDGTVIIWNATSGTMLSSLKSSNSAVTSIAFSRDDKKIVAGGRYMGYIDLWDATTFEKIRTYDKLESINAIAMGIW